MLKLKYQAAAGHTCVSAGGLGPVIHPSGEVAADMAMTEVWDGQFKGKNWRQFINE